MNYSIDNKTETSKANNIFRKYCKNLSEGKKGTKKPCSNGVEVDLGIDITPENFTMLYDYLPKNNIWHKCRAQMPKYLFISDTGVILSFYHAKSGPIVYKGNSTSTRNATEIQVKFATSCKYSFSKDKDGKEIPRTLYNYSILAIIWASEGKVEYVLDQKLEDNLRDYGLECFGKKNGGNTKDASIRGERGLVIDGIEVIAPEDMLEVHHIQKETISPRNLEILPHWLHDYLKVFTATIEGPTDLQRLVTLDKAKYQKLCYMCPYGLFLIDYSKSFGEDVFIYYEGVNVKPLDTSKLVNPNEYRYFMIHKLTREERIDFEKKRKAVERYIANDFYKVAFINYARRDIEDTLKNFDSFSKEELRNKTLNFTFVSNGKLNVFGLVYNDGKKELYKRQIYKLLNDNDYFLKACKNAMENKTIIYSNKNLSVTLYWYENYFEEMLQK